MDDLRADQISSDHMQPFWTTRAYMQLHHLPEMKHMADLQACEYGYTISLMPNNIMYD